MSVRPVLTVVSGSSALVVEDVSVASTDGLPSPTLASRSEGWMGSALAPVAIFAIARLISAAFVISQAPHQPDLTRDLGWHVEGTRSGSPSYWEVLSNWDGQWFKTIALHGYSGAVPGDAPTQTPLAFPPLFPLLVRVFMHLTGGSFEVVASVVSTIAACIGMVLLHRWLRVTRGAAIAVVAVAVLSFFPSSPVFQMAYSDGLALPLTVVATRAAVERRWTTLVLASAALTFTRPVLLALVCFLLVLEALRPRVDSGRRYVDRATLLAAGALTLLAFGWPAVAGLIAGSPTAYFDTLSAWTSNGRVGGGWFGGLWNLGLRIEASLMVAIIVIIGYLRWRRRSEKGSADHLGAWAGVYILFVLFATPPGTGIIRHALLTLVPLGSFGPMTDRRTTSLVRFSLLSCVLIAELVLQWWWVANVLIVDDSPAQSLLP